MSKDRMPWEGDREAQKEMAFAIGEACDGKRFTDVVAALGFMTIHIISKFAQTPEASRAGLEGHIKDLRENMEIIARGKARGH